MEEVNWENWHAVFDRGQEAEEEDRRVINGRAGIAPFERYWPLSKHDDTACFRRSDNKLAHRADPK